MLLTLKRKMHIEDTVNKQLQCKILEPSKPYKQSAMGAQGNTRDFTEKADVLEKVSKGGQLDRESTEDCYKNSMWKGGVRDPDMFK